MSSITLVLPFALPPAELAPDLIKVLDAPALASLLGRSVRSAMPPPSGDRTGSARVLPHEQWLADRLLGPGGWGGALHTALAGASSGTDRGATWWLLHPAHIEITRSSLLLNDLRHLNLSEEHSRALFDSVLGLFTDSGLELRYGDAATWLLRADDWAGLDVASPDAAAGMDLSNWLPRGDSARTFRRLQNEVQMLWHEHPVNTARATQGQAAVNALWLWGPGHPAERAAAAALAAVDPAPWLRPLVQIPADIETLARSDQSIVVCDVLSQAGVAADWSAWLYHLQQLDRTLFQPLLTALRARRFSAVELLLGDRERLISRRITPMSLHAFWRKPAFTALQS